MIVRDLMTADVVVVHPATPLKEVARSLVEHRISGVPVLYHPRRLQGLLNEADFLVNEASPGGPHRPRAAPHARGLPG